MKIESQSLFLTYFYSFYLYLQVFVFRKMPPTSQFLWGGQQCFLLRLKKCLQPALLILCSIEIKLLVFLPQPTSLITYLIGINIKGSQQYFY